MEVNEISKNLAQQKECYKKGHTHNLQFRIKQLKILKEAIKKYQDRIIEANYLDMGKPTIEALLGEVSISISYIDFMLKNLPSWNKPTRYKIPAGHLPGSAFVIPEPYGVVLIMSPWNYPFQLAMVPLIGAIAAGNCAVIKPSEISAHTSKIIAKIINECFDPNYISVIEGGIEVGELLIEQRWDFIFFIGSTKVGKKVMHAASQFLTPLVLELGGKSPCIVDRDIKLDVTVKRIAHGKFFNAGQSCVAPDYILIHKEIKKSFIKKMDQILKQFYGNYLEPVEDMARIVDERHFSRLIHLMDESKVVLGGKSDPESKYISPTLLEGVDWNDPIMQEEIFGPVLPILEYENFDEALTQIDKQPKPLNIYLFSENKKIQDKVIYHTRSGTLSINDALVHFVLTSVPFGGVGESGMGHYHGKASFDAFSHKKTVLKKSLLYDVKQRFAPYKMSFKTAERLFKFLSG